MKIKMVSTIFSLLIFLLPTVAAAWFVQPYVPDCPTVSSTLRSCETPYNLSVYDDLFAKADDGDGTVYIRPSNPFFVPANEIELDLPITVLTKQSLSTMEYLDRLLLANLRIHLLIQEYKALQKRTEKVLKNLDLPFFDSPAVKSMPGYGGKNITHHRKHLENKLAGILHNGRTVPTNALSSASSSLPDLKRLSILSGGEHMSGTTSVPSLRKAPGLRRGSSTAQTGFIAGGGDDYSLTRSYETQVPWIFRVAQGFFSYMVSHKVEVGFYGMLIFLVCCFISLQAKI